MIIKKGFTLVEILIALTIVGLVSALVVPQLVNNVTNQKTGLSVAKMVSQVEVSCRNYLNKDREVQYLTFKDALEGNEVTANTSAGRAQVLQRFLEMGKYNNGASLWADDSETVATTNIDEESKMIAFKIDTNGVSKKPNADGRDVFIFYMNNSCRMIPYGAEDMEYKTKCNPESAGSITDGKTCAARLVKDGYKITYIK